MGNHVADWEHVTVRLRNNRPWKMYVGAHNFGGVYTWNGHTFVKGKSLLILLRTVSNYCLKLYLSLLGGLEIIVLFCESVEWPWCS